MNTLRPSGRLIAQGTRGPLRPSALPGRAHAHLVARRDDEEARLQGDDDLHVLEQLGDAHHPIDLAQAFEAQQQDAPRRVALVEHQLTEVGILSEEGSVSPQGQVEDLLIRDAGALLGDPEIRTRTE